MKALFVSALLALSLGLNALALLGLASPATIAPLVGLIRPGSAPAAAAAPDARPRAGSPAGTSATQASGKWAGLKSDNPATLVANLRAAGFSDSEIRAILANQLSQKVIARRRELMGPPQDLPYWRNASGPTNSVSSNPQAQAELRALSQANAKLIESLLGPNPVNQVSPYERLQFADLPSDKVDQLKLINSDYADLISAVQSGVNGAYFPEDRAKLKLYNEEKDKDIRALLTPEEYDNYQFRTSTTANSMRNNLQVFQPTEDEFRRIFALQYAFDQQYNTAFGGLDLELQRQRSQAQGDLTAQIKALLSPERVADYEKATDSSYRQALALTTRLELPKDAATQLWTLQKDTQQRMTALRTDRNLAPDARNQALAALQQDVVARASGVLGGPRGLEAYKVNGGQWMQNLVPQPAPTGAAGAGGTVIINGGTIRMF